LKAFDTARIYAGGKSEVMAGNILAEQKSHEAYVIATKAHPSQEGGLTPAGIRAQLAASLEALQATKVAVLYLHQPDVNSAVAGDSVWSTFAPTLRVVHIFPYPPNYTSEWDVRSA
jgi:aryl-alcohol dehydrogenase-like predicted oxidoreductase